MKAHRRGGTGNRPFLSDDAMLDVAIESAEGHFDTAADAQSWIADRYGVEYTLGGVYSLLERLRKW